MQADRACEKRMAELAGRVARTGVTQVAWFLSPAEQMQAEICARQAGVIMETSGGAADAERKVVAFQEYPEEIDWPILCLRITWHAKYGAPGHRDLLGAILGLGFDREKVGDLFIEEGQAVAFVLRDVGQYIAANLTRAGSTPVKVEVAEEWAGVAVSEGQEARATVASLRLDAVLGAALHLSRTKAAALVSSGRVQINHQIELRADRQVQEGAVLSVRGMGRVTVQEVGSLTKKGRISLTMLRY